MIPPFLRPFLAAILMAPLMSLAGWATAQGFEVTNEQVAQAVDYILTVGIPVLASLAVILRRFIDKKANPANTASGHLATQGVAQKNEILAAKKTEERLEKAGLGAEQEDLRYYRPPENQD